MKPYSLLLVPTGTQTRMMLTQGPRELMRAVLPPLLHLANARAVGTLLQGLALWVDRPVCVVLCANASGTTHWLGLTDAQGCGVRTLFYEVQLVEPRDKRQANRVSALAGDWQEVEQLSLWHQGGGQP